MNRATLAMVAIVVCLAAFAATLIAILRYDYTHDRVLAE